MRTPMTDPNPFDLLMRDLVRAADALDRQADRTDGTDAERLKRIAERLRKVVDG